MNTLIFLLQLSLYLLSFAVTMLMSRGTLEPLRALVPVLAGLLCCWLLSVALTKKYRLKYYQLKVRYILAGIVHANLLLFVITAVFALLFLRHSGFAMIALYCTLLYSCAEIILFALVTRIGITKLKNNPVKATTEIKKYAQEELPLTTSTKENAHPDFSQLQMKWINQEIVQALWEANSEQNNGLNVTLHGKEIPGQVYDVIILDARINDLGDINATFDKIYSQLRNGGFIVAPYTELTDFESNFIKGPGFIQFIKRTHYYFYYRALPKIPYLNVFYRVLSANKNKVISKAEAWGRLYYCGFDVTKETKKEDMTFLKAQKLFTRSENPDPSFSPVITLNRVSLDGYIIKIHKVRSMYPYSEFLQKKVFELGSLGSTGKFNNDFRITVFGKIFRKYWIDELPQILDWLSGEIKLVGIRAMSQHYFSLYSKEYQELYFQVKPGIFSPIFDEKTASFEEIQRIEQEYLERYLKRPFLTDIQYFFKTITHIFKGVRSK